MKKRLKVLFNTLVKTFMITVVLVIAVLSTNKDFGILGFHFYHVVTRSMNSVIPVGSLVIVKETNPSNIGVGDDITFLVSEDTSKTHRVVQITNNYNDSNQIGFTTKGVDNPSNDVDVVLEKNVVGVVVHHVKDLGLILDYFASRAWVFILIIILANLIWFCFKKIVLEKGENNEIK